MSTPAEAREERLEQLKALNDPDVQQQIEAFSMNAADFVMLGNRRAFYQAAWREIFTSYDVLIAPTALDSAFRHEERQFDERTLMVDNTEVPYFHNITFPMLAIFTGLPATAFPAGLDNQGLPLGLQAIGPYLEDRTTMKFAQLLEDAWHSFEPPPAYQ